MKARFVSIVIERIKLRVARRPKREMPILQVEELDKLELQQLEGELWRDVEELSQAMRGKN